VPCGNNDNSYLANGVVFTDTSSAPRSLAAIPDVATTILFHEHSQHWNSSFLRPQVNSSTTYTAWMASTAYDVQHMDGGNLLFCDGHVKWRKQSSICVSDFGLGTPSTGPSCGVAASGATAAPLF
jgi:prepilin-type processing-associated H-X9-DG protein